MSYKVFTIQNGHIHNGAQVERFELSSGSALGAIIIGEVGRGRERGVLPVAGDAPAKPHTIIAADVGQTRAGKAKLIPAQHASDASHAIVVFRTRIGYRGGNSHSGDRLESDEEGNALTFAPFPGTLLCEGRIAQGDAGRMGAGFHLVAVMPRGVVFRTGYSGRLYGSPAAHYYAFDGEAIRVATWDERLMLDRDPLEV